MNQSHCCVIIGASHAGVNLAFALRKEGWQGSIKLIDADPHLPYHRPPLSKGFLTETPVDGREPIEKIQLKPIASYEKNDIELMLGLRVESIDADAQQLTLTNGETLSFTKLVLATGARPFMPPIDGLQDAKNLFPLRTATDVIDIKTALTNGNKNVVIIGGGYIGLETAASLRKLGHQVTVLERESRILARVTSPQLSAFFTELHQQHGVEVLTDKDVVKITTDDKGCNQIPNQIICADGSQFSADIIIVGVGIRVNSELAAAVGLKIEHGGIKVDRSAKTSFDNIYAIGDCSYHFNPYYQRFVRLESVQNAVDQAKIAAQSICGKEAEYNAVPWFWSDQYHVKLQMVGVGTGYTDIIERIERDDNSKRSLWYFKEQQLLGVDAVNHSKAYVLGTRFIKAGIIVNKQKLADTCIDLNAENVTR
ncbi:NAD(P)/FAD-dependent oxidoreductase [Thalassotalea litorea]|uniref:NAD(P)/FAD-dependent oxidoreductase n=1 Tax=Thalassotalea litorea TaxID=2020715 RepID=A0A5R9II49_9GAMM|nr:FAD/NAD(P)-binding oxidoreductase [Thalassotalea litorea]TLU65185.1 NAD(P)/FAD-dependent oxidoreductase [Thalassotalea litorea]